MLKSILGVIVGVIVMWLFTFAIFSCAYRVLGADRVFETGSYDISSIWIVCMIVFGLIGGIVGGLVCAAISKRKGACQAFVGVILALGLVSAVVTKMKEHPDASRSGDITMFEAMGKAQTPSWLCFVNPFVVAAGVLLGARMKKLPAA